MIYSGWTLGKLRRSQSVGMSHLLACTDILVDGPFIAAQHDPELLWRGSKNQKIHFLSDQFDTSQPQQFPVLRGVDLMINENGKLHISGMHAPKLTDLIVKHLKLDQ